MASIKTNTRIYTIERFILDRQAEFPDATGALTSLLYDMAVAGKLISSHTTRAGLADILGSAGQENVQGEEQQKLDVYAHRVIYQLNDHTGRLAVMGSEEEEEVVPIPDKYSAGKYVLLFDPLDGSSNIEYNVSVGTIFSIFRRKSTSGPGTLDDCLQRGVDLVAAGYIVYGSSTMLVYSTGDGVHGFTLDPSIGEFLLSHPDIQLPAKPKYYSSNQGYQRRWSEGVQRYTRWLQGEEDGKYSLSLRYIGSMIADIHRNLLGGGVFYYPADTKSPNGKLRLLYEAIPMSFLIEQAGGYASTGYGPLRDILPEGLHQRTPLFVGNRDLVEKAEEFIAKYDG
ncbi:MAG TPA: class 1 fructose-bisphosphatase [Anaerolineae bacterium]|nr:class 1 fructose-bisphosphatase [Anaerolineae bacterium]MCB0180277.1 class 1 fructose-bisphosphatase [Anaerolineae bacterium]HRV94771.1 class 1 fructose-bisphosphatase [Anaerolineae bacterium]